MTTSQDAPPTDERRALAQHYLDLMSRVDEVHFDYDERRELPYALTVRCGSELTGDRLEALASPSPSVRQAMWLMGAWAALMSLAVVLCRLL